MSEGQCLSEQVASQGLQGHVRDHFTGAAPASESEGGAKQLQSALL